MSARILVVEDNPITRKMFRVTLQIEGYTVLEAPDARTALRLMAEGRPDLVVLDLILPDLDGFDLVPLLRERPGGAEVPIIACSGFLSRLEATRVSALGFADFLIKPVEPSRFVRTIQAYLPARGAGVAASGEGRLVLAVDDDPVQLRLMRFHLERLGFRVTTASNGAEALVTARQALPEAIVSDVLMPGLDGFQLCLAIRREPRLAHVPVVLASASYVEEADRALARKVGASGLVFRAPDCREAIEALLQSLRGLVARPEAPDEQLEEEHFHRKVRQLERQVAQNAALVQRTSFQAAVLSMLGKLSSALARGAESGIAPADLLASLLDVGGLSTGALFLWDSDGRLALAGQYGYPDEAVAALADFCGHLERAAGEFTEGAVVAVPSSGLPAATDFLAQVGMKSALLVPLVSRDERIGVLLLASRLRDLLDPDWSAFAQTIGAQISQTVGLGRVFARLAAAEEQYRGLFENAAEGIFQTSVEGRALIANPALARILGYDSPEELVARVTDVARQLYTDPARRDELLRRVREEGAVSGFEMPARRKDGSTVWLSVSARAVRGPDGTVLHLEGRAEDITARKRAQETAAALAEVGRELVATLDFAQVAERVVSTVARVFQVRRAGLYRLDPVSRTLTCIAIAGEGDPGPWLGRVLPFGAGAAGRAVAEGRAASSPDIPTDSLGPLPEWLVERFQAEGLRSGAGAPLIARGKTLGALDLADRAGRVFTEGELGLLSVFADQAAAALQNAELYEEAERRRHAAEVLADLGRLVSQSLDLTEVRQRVVDGVRELLGGHSAALLRIDQESGDLVTTAASGEREIFGVTPVLPRGTGASGLAVRERRPVASPDMLADDRFTVSAEIRTLAERASCRAVLAVPLSMQERVVGVLNVSGRTGRIFGEEEVGLVQGFANEAAVALENARLYEDARAARDFLRSIATNSADAIITTDVRGRTTYFSPGAEEMLGYHAGEVLGRPLAQFYRSGVEEARALMRRLWTEGRIQHYESAFRGKDGRWVEVSASVSLLRDADGRVTGTVGVLRDVTEPKGAAEALRESEERFRRAFDDSGIGMALQTMDGRYLRVNRVYGEMVGYTAEELLAVSFRDVLHPEDQAADVERDRRMLSGEVGHYQREKRYRHKSGRVVWVLSSVSLIRDAAGRPRDMLVQVQDVTERKRMEAELEQQREARLQSDKLAAMGQLLAGVAHELNNPLSVVMGRAALLSRALEGGPLAAQADQIGQAAERCARIVKNFLALARHRAPERGRVAISPLVQEAIELLAYPLRVDSVEVVVDLAPDLPALWADGHQLHQVLVNLITNAHHALRGAPAPRRLTLTASADPGQSRVAIEVADTGPGIPPEVLPRLFEPFFTTKPPGQGTGLGLSLCRGIVEDHAGSITVESGVGQGARFRIELPVTAPEAEREEPPVARRAAVRGKSILVVDDEADVAEVLAEILALDDHEVDVAPNGQVALDRILEKPYDLVFSDIRMPELDGPGLYQRLEQFRHGLVRRFVFLTGDVLGPETRAFLERTGAPSVSKPFAASEIRRVLRQMLLPGDQREPR